MTETPADPRRDLVASAVARWSRQLVDLGGRNTLLWYRDLSAGTLDLTHAHPSGISRLMAGGSPRLRDLFREDTAFDDALRRARTIAAKARELLEERGIATLHLAVGMATWDMPRSSRAPMAPVLLRSATLRAISPSQDDFVLSVSSEVELNPVLAHYLLGQRGLALNVAQVEGLTDTPTGFDPQPAYRALTEICRDIEGFTISPRQVIGTFSYAKLPMVIDLAVQVDELANNDVVAALAGDPDALTAVRSSPPAPDLRVDPRREHLVLDADATQIAAIEAARAGANLVIQGPPGTGKSQTIANLIAALMADGRRVLFVAEKRAAIDAVHKRLRQVGLDDLVLDLYDGVGSRRAIAREFGAALDRVGTVGAGEDPQQISHRTRLLLAAQGELTDHRDALHERREEYGVSAFAAQEAVSRLEATDPAPRSKFRLRGEALHAVDREQMEADGAALSRAASLGAWSEGVAADPWFGARIPTSEDAVRALEIAERYAGGGIASFDAMIKDVFGSLRVPEAASVTDWGTMLGTASRIKETLELFRSELFDVPLADLIGATGTREYRRSHGVELGWFDRWRLRRQAEGFLRPGPRPANLHDELVAADGQRQAWNRLMGKGGRPEVPPRLGEAVEAYARLSADLEWLGARLAGTAEGGRFLTDPIVLVAERMDALAAAPERLRVIPSVIGILDETRSRGWGPLIDELAARRISPDHVPAEVAFAWWTSVCDDIALADPNYGEPAGDRLRTVVKDFADADRQHLRDNAARVRESVLRRARQELRQRPAQEAMVRSEAGRSRGHRPLRDLVSSAPDVLTALKPCWMMSPLVVAGSLPPGAIFDVVIFDEASQIPPAQAVSAIARAHHVVVAGDDRQLPPTTFFTTPADASADEVVGEGQDINLTSGFESVLDVLAAVAPVRRLNWHYRSTDERLIAFANDHLYDGSLVTFPGAGTASPLAVEYVGDAVGILTEGSQGVETTQGEVDRVVELVLEHARTRPHESLGVIALGITHANRLDEAIRAAVATERELQPFFSDERDERFFVKNLERVQGDERDAIILSVGYGKTPHGRVIYRFGPINQEGGERRLNVAITRSRRRMAVVTSLRSIDLDPERLKSRGAQLLREFLAYAERAQSDELAPTVGARGGDLPLVMNEMARRLRAHGLTVHEGYGHGEYPIDLAVEDPARPGALALAVESDGPAYAQLATVRDRDRLRAEHLERLGWAHHRIWTADAFRDPARDVSAIVGLARRQSAQRADLLRDQAGAQDDVAAPGDVVEPAGDDGAGVDGAADEAAGQERGGKDPDGDPSPTA
ncbi:MAG: AAA domain-containing protein [Actinomycetia bacterium]|nr:AAA domain-containing protein [Actinomycetes bacterium]